MHNIEPNTSTINVCVAFVALHAVPLATISTTDANRPKRKDQKPMCTAAAWLLAKLSIKQLFICRGYSTLWLALMLYCLTLNGPFTCLM